MRKGAREREEGERRKGGNTIGRKEKEERRRRGDKAKEKKGEGEERREEGKKGKVKKKTNIFFNKINKMIIKNRKGSDESGLRGGRRINSRIPNRKNFH